MELSQPALDQPYPTASPRFKTYVRIRYLGLALLTASIIIPLVWIFLLSFKDRREFASNPFGLPQSWSLENYLQLIQDPRILTFVLNSLFASLISVGVVVVASTLAGYALARLEFRGQRLLFTLFLLGDSIPLFVVLIPLFIFIQSIGLSGSRLSLIMPYAAMNMGLAVFMMRGFMRSISTDIEDAARVDGCSTWQLIVHILLPLVRPGALVVAIVTFIIYWNEYFLVQVLMPNQELFTLPAGLATLFMGRFGANYPMWGAGITLSILPVIVLFIFAQDKIVQGWTFSEK